MTLAPELDLVKKITKSNYKKNVEAYIQETKKRSQRERISETKKYNWCIYWKLCFTSFYR